MAVLSQDEIDELLTEINTADPKEANKAFDEILECFEKYLTANIASEQIRAKAQYFFGIIYNYGVMQNLERIIYWYTKSAEQGDADAQYELGILYEKGRGVPKNYTKAAEWFAKAAAQGNERAKDALAKAEAAALDEEIRKQVRKKLSNKIFPCLNGQKYIGLTAIPTDNPKRCIYLLRRMDDKTNSLWNIEFLDDEGNADMWPYDGADSEELLIQLLELHVETGLDNVV